MITIYGDETTQGGARILRCPITLSGIKCSIKALYIIRSMDGIMSGKHMLF